MALVYNVNNTATQVLIAKAIKENYYAPLLHRDGKGVTEHYETNVSSLRILKRSPLTDSARELGGATNGGFFNSHAANVAGISEYDLPLLYFYDTNYDIPEVQQDLCPANIFDGAMKDIGGRIATEINASTIAHQLKAVYDAVGAKTNPAWAGNAVVLAASNADYYQALLDASGMLDDGNETAGVQAFPFDEREILLTTDFRKNVMSAKGVLLGGSNFAQSMLAKGAVSPEDKKEYGTMYIGEIDGIPCYLVPKTIISRAKAWIDDTKGTATEITGKLGALVVAASATDRGISDPSYVKVIDSPNGAGKRLQPKTRWGVNVCYANGIVPIFANGVRVPAAANELTMTVKAPGNV